MEKAVMRFSSRPRLEEPVLVGCLPGIGSVGENVADFLIQMFDGELFAELYSPRLPDYVIVEAGICRLPRYAFYAIGKVKPNLIVLLGDAQPSHDDYEAHYELCEEVVDFAERMEVEAVVGVGGFLAPGSPREVYVAYTSEALAKAFSEAGAKTMMPGHIIGGAGLLPAMAAERGMEGASLLASVLEPVNDREASLKLLRVLLKGLGVGPLPMS